MGFGGLTYDSAWYHLVGLTAHAVSEHTFLGRHRPLEVHVLHKKYDSARLVIAAITFVPPEASLLQMNSTRADGEYKQPMPEEPGYNPIVNMFLQNSPPVTGETKQGLASDMAPFDLGPLLEGATFFEYEGTTTAPPCAEVVTWMVRREPITASVKQLQLMEDALFQLSASFGNFRATMPILGRTIDLRVAEEEAPPPQLHIDIPPSPNAMPDREYQAMYTASNSLRAAKQTLDYVTDVDHRIRQAALAHARELMPGAPTPYDTTTTIAPLDSAAAIGAGFDPTKPLSPMDLAKMAGRMADGMAAAAKDAMHEATNELHARVNEVAKKEGFEAARAVGESIFPGGWPVGHPNAPSGEVSAVSGGGPQVLQNNGQPLMAWSAMPGAPPASKPPPATLKNENGVLNYYAQG